MPKPDVNLLSFNGPYDDHRTVDIPDPLDGTGFSDTLKFSTSLQDFKGTFDRVVSGSEDAVDVNNLCNGVDVTADLFVLQNCTMGFTVKGGSQNVRLTGIVQGSGKETDVDLGNISDQSQEKTRGVRLNLKKVDGSPVRVRVLNADWPVEEPGSGPYKYVFPWRCELLRRVSVLVLDLYRRLR